MHDIESAVAEARRAVTELGAVAVIGTPNPVNGQHLHDEACEPLWDELEGLNVPIGYHPTGKPRSRTMPAGAMSVTPISTRSRTRSAIRSS